MKEEEEDYLPISLLTPLTQNWKIKARVTRKSEKKEYRNQKGQGVLFSVDLLDNFNCEITGTFFNTVALKFEDVIQTNQVYIFQGGQISENRSKQFNKPHDFIIIFSENSIIQLCEDDKEIQQQKVKVVQLDKAEIGQTIDICAIVQLSQPLVQIQLKNGSLKSKRELQIFDKALLLTEITLWGDLAEKEFEKNDILFLKSVQVNSYQNQKKLSSSFNSILIENISDYEQATDLFNWFSEQEINEQFLQSTIQKTAPREFQLKTLKQILDQGQELVTEDQIIYSNILAFIYNINSEKDLYYLSCAVCKKKVDIQNDQYFCHKCNVLSESCQPRYMFNCKAVDNTASIWVNFGDESGSQLIQKSAVELKFLKDQDQMDGLNKNLSQIISKASYKEYHLVIRTQLQTYNNEQRLKHTVLSVDKNRNVIKECQFILQQIHLYNQLC